MDYSVVRWNMLRNAQSMDEVKLKEVNSRSHCSAREIIRSQPERREWVHSPPLETQDDAAELVEIIRSQKVKCLKMAIFQLQKQNAELTRELFERSMENIGALDSDIVDTDLINLHTKKIDIKVTPGSETKPMKHIDTIKKMRHVAESLPTFQIESTQNQHSPSRVIQLERRVKELESQVSCQSLLLQQQELQVKSLVDSKRHLMEKFRKQLRLHLRRVSYEVQGFLVELRAKYLMREANLGSERTKQLEHYFSILEKRFHELLLRAQERSLQNRHTDLKRISELENELSTLAQTSHNKPLS